MSRIQVAYKVAELPASWDDMAGNYFQLKQFLEHAQLYNPCKQRYYLNYENDELKACAVVYSLRMDLLTYLRIKSPLKFNIIGIPCSVSSAGIFGKTEAVDELKRYIYEHERGAILALNLKRETVNSDFANGKTLPTILFKNEYISYDHYLSCLRAPYRRRLLKIINRSEDLSFVKVKNHHFTLSMHKQYLDVWKRSKGQLEKLSLDFFKMLPETFELTTIYLGEKLLGWYYTVKYEMCLYFFMGGIDYQYNYQYASYFNILNSIIKMGIEDGVSFIELGQTAEIPKKNMGGEEQVLFMEAHHTSRILDILLKKYSYLLEYRKEIRQTNVIKCS